MAWQGVDPTAWSTKMKNFPRKAVNIFAFEVFKRVVARTPVDTGAARQNWLVTTNNETNQANPKKTSGNVLSEGGSVIESAKGDDTIFIQNNLPYIRKLEFGGYSKTSKTGKTVNGFSLQAPQGMVGITLAKASQLWNRAVKTAMGT